jgi:hypothetical protein
MEIRGRTRLLPHTQRHRIINRSRPACNYWTMHLIIPLCILLVGGMLVGWEEIKQDWYDN